MQASVSNSNHKGLNLYKNKQKNKHCIRHLTISYIIVFLKGNFSSGQKQVKCTGYIQFEVF